MPFGHAPVTELPSPAPVIRGAVLGLELRASRPLDYAVRISAAVRPPLGSSLAATPRLQGRAWAFRGPRWQRRRLFFAFSLSAVMPVPPFRVSRSRTALGL